MLLLARRLRLGHTTKLPIRLFNTVPHDGKEITHTRGEPHSSPPATPPTHCAPPNRPLGLLRFDDPKVAFGCLSTPELVRAWLVYYSLSFPLIVRNAESLYKLSVRLLGERNTHRVLKKTMFAQFCAGEDEFEVDRRIRELQSQGIGAILDYAAEAPIVNAGHDHEEDEHERNTQIFMQTIGLSSRLGRSPVAVKVTGLAEISLLEILSEYVVSSSFCSSSPSLPGIKDLKLPENLEISVRLLIDRLEKISSAGVTAGVPVMFDAEWVAVQPAIDWLSMQMMQRWNSRGSAAFLPVSTTYQCYLRSTPIRIKSDLEISARLKFKIGVKLVRGAYMVREKALSSLVICKDANETSKQYHEAIEVLKQSDQVGSVLLATHNEESVRKGISAGSKFRIAQLLGMGDNLTNILAAEKFPVYKYLPFGPVGLVVPYLLRRAQENSTLLGSPQVAVERRLLSEALTRRVSDLWTSLSLSTNNTRRS